MDSTVITEKQIEKRLVAEVKKLGGAALKFTSPGTVGVPDRIVLLPNGRVRFVEVKRKGGVVSAAQKLWLGKLTAFGFKAVVLDDADEIGEVLT